MTAGCSPDYAGGGPISRPTIYDGKQWEELFVDLDSIAIFPGRPAERRYSLPPTLHRVLQQGGADAPKPDDPRTSNVTLLLGAT